MEEEEEGRKEDSSKDGKDTVIHRFLCSFSKKSTPNKNKKEKSEEREIKLGWKEGEKKTFDFGRSWFAPLLLLLLCLL